MFQFYTKTESFDFSIEPTQTEDPPKQFKREYWVIFRKFWVVAVCFGLLRNSSVCFGCFDIVPLISLAQLAKGKKSRP
jgi:hypothetical protein